MFDVRDVTLEAQAEAQVIIREVLEELLAPQMMGVIKKLWASMPDDAKEQFKQERPRDYAALMNDLKRRES